MVCCHPPSQWAQINRKRGEEMLLTKREWSGKWRCRGSNYDGEAILWQYCRPVLSACILPFLMKNFIANCIEHIDFFRRPVHNNSCSKQRWAVSDVPLQKQRSWMDTEQWRQYQAIHHFSFNIIFITFNTEPWERVFLYSIAVRVKAKANKSPTFCFTVVRILLVATICFLCQTNGSFQSDRPPSSECETPLWTPKVTEKIEFLASSWLWSAGGNSGHQPCQAKYILKALQGFLRNISGILAFSAGLCSAPLLVQSPGVDDVDEAPSSLADFWPMSLFVILFSSLLLHRWALFCYIPSCFCPLIKFKSSISFRCNSVLVSTISRESCMWSFSSFSRLMVLSVHQVITSVSVCIFLGKYGCLD